MQRKVLETHSFVFNDQDNGRESLSLETVFLGNGDPDGVFTNQTLTLQSCYCYSASFELCETIITPENLRKLANELESVLIKAKHKTHKAEPVVV